MTATSTYRVGLWRFGYDAEEIEGTDAPDFELALGIARIRATTIDDDQVMRIFNPDGEPVYTIDHTGEADYRK